MNLLFSFAGRIGRGKWWLGLLLGILISGVIIGAGALMVPWADVMLKGPDGQPITNPDGSFPIDFTSPKMLPGFIGYGLGVLLSLWMGLAIHLKRLHDRGKSGWWVLIALIPLAGFIWMIIDLGILEGQAGANKYGPDPRGAI